MIAQGIAGRFKIEAVDTTTGARRELAPWFNNLITDQGLNHIGSSGIGSFCMVGTGTNTPANTDTTLGSQLAYTVNSTITHGGQSSIPYYSWARAVFRFDAGVATGNLSEIGIGISSTLVFSRTLIKDSGGNPTTITVLPTEALDVTYELRLYPNTTDVPHSTVISGVTYTGVIRPRYATATGEGNLWTVRMFDTRASLNGTSPKFTVFSGNIGDVLSGPSGDQQSISGSITEDVYSANSKVRTGTVTCGLAECNVSGGIQAVSVNTTLGSFQIGFSPPIPKDATKVLTLGLSLSWNRMVI